MPLITPFLDQRNSPLQQLEGQGNYVTLEGFGSCLDVNSGYWYKILGYNNSELLAARNRNQTGHFISGSFSHPSAEYLAQRLLSLTSFAQVCYSVSGSQANDNALKAAFLYHRAQGREKRDLIVSLKGSYHGTTELLCHVTGYDFATFLPSRDISRKLSIPLDPLKSLSYVQELSDLIEKEGLHDRIAAFIYEPVMASRGVVPLSPLYLQKIAEICKEHDILMIGDEVTTGFGRTGRLFAYENTQVCPDILVLGKGLTNGDYPLSVTLFPEKIVHAFEDLEKQFPRSTVYIFGTTFAGAPAACDIACTILDILEREDYLKSITLKKELIRQTFIGLTYFPQVKQIREASGVMCGIELESSKLAKEVQERLLQKRIRMIPEGRTVMFMPPFTITEEEISYFAQSLESCLREL